jgi:hypothetical protein
MQSRFIRYSSFLLAVLIAISVCSLDADAQRRRKRRATRAKKPAATRPVITNPDIAPAGSEQSGGTETERIVSTADQSVNENEQTPDSTQPKKSNGSTGSASDADMQRTIHTLSNQVDRLNDKLTEMQRTDSARLDMERLTRAEQRAESLRGQQLDVETRLADLQAKAEQIEYELRPENIERAANYGTTRPEEAREARRRQLENERSRVQSQIKLLENSRTRLAASVNTADAEVDTLRRKLELQQAQPDSGAASTEPKKNKPE